ncbi:MAG TPA: hypothetical protein K8V30_09615 [Metalysinibacillus jejuensis]|uniref:Uncharacterized protein n=1 Tax=Metalysinibacillus jejuensis TaxID=914327 RepID=A0A921NE36_9BACL|nr:hypothetical protein [Metalysinibacillus jejuensis]
MKIACLHAHHTNQVYMDTLFSDIYHVVKPRIRKAEILATLEALSTQANYVYVTCTDYIAQIEGEPMPKNIVKIDAPFFAALAERSGMQTLVFTNTDTISGTIARLHKAGRAINYEIIMIENAYELLLNGQKEAHDALVMQKLRTLAPRTLAVAQLSLVDAAEAVDANILHPLATLQIN